MSFLHIRCCEGALRDVPRVLVSADGFLGDLRNQLAKKIQKTAGVPMNRLSCTISNWMRDSFLSYVALLEARGDRKFQKGLADFDIDAKDHKWKEKKTGHNVTAAWCFPTMLVTETVCDFQKLVVYRDILKGPRDKEVSVGFKNVIVLENGDIVVVVPPLHFTYQRTWKGTSFIEKVIVSVSTVFIPNANFTEPLFPSDTKVHDVSFEGADKSMWPFLPGYEHWETYVTYKLGKTILEARAFYDSTFNRSDMFRGCIMDQADKWAAITEEEIGVARHLHFMNPRMSRSQT